jgi:hypothetical protein
MDFDEAVEMIRFCILQYPMMSTESVMLGDKESKVVPNKLPAPLLNSESIWASMRVLDIPVNEHVYATKCNFAAVQQA